MKALCVEFCKRLRISTRKGCLDRKKAVLIKTFAVPYFSV